MILWNVLVAFCIASGGINITGELRASLSQSWEKGKIRGSRKVGENELYIGFTKFYTEWALGDYDPVGETIAENSDRIQELIIAALDDINKE